MRWTWFKPADWAISIGLNVWPSRVGDQTRSDHRIRFKGRFHVFRWLAIWCLVLGAVCGERAPLLAADVDSPGGTQSRVLGQEAALANEAGPERARLEARIAALREQVRDREEQVSEARARLQTLTETRDSLLASGSDWQQAVSVQADFKEFQGNLAGLLKTGPSQPQDRAKWPAGESGWAEVQAWGPGEVQSLLDFCFENLESGAEIGNWRGPVIDEAGRERSGRNTHLGHLTAITEVDGRIGYLTPGSAPDRFLLAGRPSWLIQRNLRSFIAGETKSLYLDLSGGAAVRQLSQTKSAMDRLLSGGPLVWPILLIGLAALFMVGERLIYLVRVRRKTGALGNLAADLLEGQDLDRVEAVAAGLTGHPAGNVLRAGLAQRGQPREVLENALSEAVLKETPVLERFLVPLKVLAAASPLLGLLGTVTGMINTFEVITVHGTNDPRLMSGGISEALITTELGLAVAIPVMVAASLLKRRAQSLGLDMEEKALALTVALLKQNRPGGDHGQA